MPNLGSPQAAYYALALIVPAMVFMYSRVQFMHGRMPKASEAALHYVALTAIYYGLALPFIQLAIQTPGTWLTWWLGWLTVAFFVPCAMGLLAGWATQNNLLHTLVRKFRLNPVHAFPAAWDWRFSNCRSEWVLVTLKNGRRFGAYCGENSFMSTDPLERDLYLELTYDIPEDGGRWNERTNSILVAAGEVSTIEFFPSEPDSGGADDE